MTPLLLNDSLVRSHIADLHADADRYHLARRARQDRRPGPMRAFVARVLVRTGLRLARTEAVVPAAVIGIAARPRSDAIPLVAIDRAPAAPRRRAA